MKVYEKDKINIDFVNQKAENASYFVAESENHYKNQIKRLAQKIKDGKSLTNNFGKYKMIFIAGPTASGKTTTSGMLRRTLYNMNVKSITVSLDDFYKNREDVPPLPDGSADYDSIKALDVDEVLKCFKQLFEKNSAYIPIFNFPSGSRSGYRKVNITSNHIIIVEGIYALNPIIKDFGYKESSYTIYISAKTEFEKDGKVVLGSNDLRLMRRMIRDHNFRGMGVEGTLSMWGNVCAAEEENFLPYLDKADEYIDSVHYYEPLIYHHDLIPLLNNVPLTSKYFNQAQNIKNILGYFKELDKSIIPDDSLLREFVE